MLPFSSTRFFKFSESFCSGNVYQWLSIRGEFEKL
jgi:hypothetical protein